MTIVTDLQAVLADTDNIIQPHHQVTSRSVIAQIEAIEKLLSKAPKATNDMYVGGEDVAWGKQAKATLKALRK